MSEDDENRAQRELRERERAATLEQSLVEPAKKLGLRIRVAYSEWDREYHLHVYLIPTRVAHTISEEVFVDRNKKGAAELVLRVLDDMQLQVHDETRKQMDKLDIRERIVHLSREDKHTLNDMLMAAMQHEMRDFRSSDQGSKNVDRFSALVGKLFK